MRREGGEASVGRWGGLITDRHCALRISKFRCKLPSSKIRDAGTKMFDDIPRPTCRSVYTVSDKRLRHGGSGYETTPQQLPRNGRHNTARDKLISCYITELFILAVSSQNKIASNTANAPTLSYTPTLENSTFFNCTRSLYFSKS